MQDKRRLESLLDKEDKDCWPTMQTVRKQYTGDVVLVLVVVPIWAGI